LLTEQHNHRPRVTGCSRITAKVDAAARLNEGDGQAKVDGGIANLIRTEWRTRVARFPTLMSRGREGA
jgi:hypothetical protein